ncbi:MAG: alanine racemase [Gemmatimonadales bacterium]|nr:alanine racemase [Gemmatimonadales bacterium]
MSMSRRAFVGAAAAFGLAPRRVLSTAAPTTLPVPEDRFDPWVEVDPGLLRHNVEQVSRLAGGRPILAVVKNNAYGLGLSTAGPILASFPEVWGLAVVKADAALHLRDAGIRKPIVLMAMCSEREGHELVARDVQLSLYTDDASSRVAPLASRIGRPLDVQLYLDTGMGRMGMPYHRALPWLEDVARRPDLNVRGTFMAFVEERDFDRQQLQRFETLARDAASRGLRLGSLHAASSNGVFHLPEAHLDMVRPGIALFGAYPSEPEVERERAELKCAVRLRARVVRVARLRAGDGVSYGRNYVAQRPTWIATLPVGHSDGYPRKAVAGAKVLINGRRFPVIGAVSASHCIVELGDEPFAKVGDVATLLGPDDPVVEPNVLADAIGVSVYDLLMHLSAELPRFLV